MSIKVSNITKIYGKQKALDNVSFNVESGEIVGFLGPNGAGKSTMMKIITCFLPPNEGNVSVCDYDIYENSIEVRKNVGYLPENNPLYHEMYVKEYLEFVAGIYKLGKNSKSRIDEMIGLTGLKEEYKKQIGALSKGYKQRVGLAQALLHNPKVLILDEPTSGLDPNQIVEIRNLIKEIGKEKTVLLSTHIMQEVENMCNRVIIINKGVIVKDEKTINIQEKTTKNIIKIEFNKEISKEELNIKELNIENIVYLGENTWEITSSKDIRENLNKFSVEKGLSVLSLSKKEQSLEEIFHKLTK